MNHRLRTIVQLSVLSILALACASAAAQRNAAPASPASAATGYAGYLPGCKQRLGNGYPDPDRWCEDRWEKVQAAQPLVETIYQALQLAAKGVSDSAMPPSLPRVAWQTPARTGAPREGRIGDLAVRLPGVDDEGRLRPRSIVFEWPGSHEDDGAFKRFVWELEEALHARGDTLQRIGCWSGGGSGVLVYRVTSRDNGGRPFAIQFNEDDGRMGFSTVIEVALDGRIPTRQQLQAKYEYYSACD
ncbi:MAG: hypothetical protein KA124_01400 [Luteimonas sp.]|nr:hypothetical protein [Luteimonas sp.]